MTTNEVLKSCEPINKLAENHEYIIIEYHRVKTRFGSNYVLIDGNDNKYWSVSKINKFIETTRPEGFEVKTYDYNKFTNEKGEDIKYLDLKCKKLMD